MSTAEAQAEKIEPDTEAQSKPDAKPAPPKVEKLPPYNVLLHNDDRNDMLFVVQAILLLTPLKQFETVRRMYEAHHRGKTLLLNTHKERAELYRDQFKSKGLTVSIEPAEV